MKTIALVNNGAVDSILSWIVPEDTVLVGAVATSQMFISDQHLSYNAFQADNDIADGPFVGLLAIAGIAFIPLKIPLVAKQALYVACQVKGTCQLFFDDSAVS